MIFNNDNSKKIIFVLLFVSVKLVSAQVYDPAAGEEGCKAINKDNPQIKKWAAECTLERGPGIITFPDSVTVTFGIPLNATGVAGDGKVVSLGDGGVATLYFETPVANGEGPDFAVFENSFNDFFLELAFVEVSSDSIHFVRFRSVSLTPVEEQVGTFGTLDPRNLFNLAGKYRSGYGTPFDLNELDGEPELDINNIVSIRIIDVIGTIIDSLASHDSNGNIINDPWPTPFESGGFDLDAVGVIHNQLLISDPGTEVFPIIIYPNPVVDEIRIVIPDSYSNHIIICDMQGNVVLSRRCVGQENLIRTGKLNQGIYAVLVIDDKGNRHAEIIQKL